MKKTLLSLFGIWAVLPFTFAQSDEDQEEKHDSDDAEEKPLPDCAVTCINKGIDVGQKQKCEGEADLACLCANPDVGTSVRDCAYTECKEQEEIDAIIDYVFHVCEDEAGVTITVPTGSPTGVLPAATGDSTSASVDASATEAARPTESTVTETNGAAVTSSALVAVMAAVGFAAFLV